MADSNGDATLIKIAVFGLAVSILCTAFISVLLVNNGDYDYSEINDYRDDLVSFSGESMINDTPWVLQHVYTPWTSDLDASEHTDADGWLYGAEITDYGYLGQSANIKLTPEQKSTVPLSYTTEAADYTVKEVKWWAHNGVIRSIANAIGITTETKTTVTSNAWNFTGYRYVYDPTLPFSAENGETKVSTVDGALSLVWYNYNGQEGLSGGLDIYGGNVLLASYSATDIIADYNTGSSYATTYEFDFNGAILTLSIRFDAAAIESGVSLMQAWTEGLWSMAISSTSAGNFFDIEDSAAFTTTAGSMIKTFTKIFTFNVKDLGINNSWAQVVLWLLVGLPMTMCMLCITLRLVNGFRVI